MYFLTLQHLLCCNMVMRRPHFLRCRGAETALLSSGSSNLIGDQRYLPLQPASVSKHIIHAQSGAPPPVSLSKWGGSLGWFMSSSNNSREAEEDVAMEIAVGPAARTRRLARQELRASSSSPRHYHQYHQQQQQQLDQLELQPEQPLTHVISTATTATTTTLNKATDTLPRASAKAEDTSVSLADATFALSPHHIDPQTLVTLQRRPPVAFAVVNAAALIRTSGDSGDKSNDSKNQKEDAVVEASACVVETTSATKTTAAPPQPATSGRRGGLRQSWHSLVHVPLAHRKLVATPSIFSGVAPFPPLAASASPLSLGGARGRPQRQLARKESSCGDIVHNSATTVVTTSSNNDSSNQINNSSNQSQRPGGSECRHAEKASKCSSTQAQSLREKNPEIYDRLVRRFRSMKRIEGRASSDSSALDGRGGDSEDEDGVSDADTRTHAAPGRHKRRSLATRHSSSDNNNSGARRQQQALASVEDAILFFLTEKHKHDVLYFQRKATMATQSDAVVPQPMASPLSSLTLRYMPYSLEQIASPPRPESGDYYILSPSSLVHHANTSTSTSSKGDIAGEVIPLAQWILERQLFSLLLTGIPLFHQFVARKALLRWAAAVRMRVFRDLRQRVACALPTARRAFVGPLLQSCVALHALASSSAHALNLPPKRLSSSSCAATAVGGLAAVQEHHKQLLAGVETRLLDAKEELLRVLDTVVVRLQRRLVDRSFASAADGTDDDDDRKDGGADEEALYMQEAAAVRVSNVKWRSVPIAALRQRRQALAAQRECARQDLTLLAQYVRLVDYMFAGSVYGMVVGCVERLAWELRTEIDDNSGGRGVLCASVAVGRDGTLVLAPSHDETKHALLEGVARLVRLAAGLHLAKNAVAWSRIRGTGSLAAEGLEDLKGSEAATQAPFDLQRVLRTDARFDAAIRAVLTSLARWFGDASRQVAAFESLQAVYASVRSVRRMDDGDTRDGGGDSQAQRSASSPPVSSLTATAATSDATLPPLLLVRLTGVSDHELSTYLKSVGDRADVLDRAQHACQKLPSNWHVGFLEIQCRRAVAELAELIARERERLREQLHTLVTDGACVCVKRLQRATLVLEDRPQLLEGFCEHLALVRALREGDKQLQQDVRNVEDAVRALQRLGSLSLSPTSCVVATERSTSHSIDPSSELPSVRSKYTAAVQAQSRFVAKTMPVLTQQVNAGLLKCGTRVQRLRRQHDELAVAVAALGTADELLERHLSTFHDAERELRAINASATLYREFHSMVGLKAADIPLLVETTAAWEDAHHVARVAGQWRAAADATETGVFSEQPWQAHADTLAALVTVVRDLQLQRKEHEAFASRLLEHLEAAIVTRLQQLELVHELAHPSVKPHHWQQVLALVDATNVVSSAGVLMSDSTNITLGFLRNRNLWAVEAPIREVTRRARHDTAAETTLDEMRRRLLQTPLPLLRTDDFYEIDTFAATHLLEVFEHDLLTVQALGQVTTSVQLRASLVAWAEELAHYQRVLDHWTSAQREWCRLAPVFALPDVQQSVSSAACEFQSLDRKWRAVMSAARGASSLPTSLREVISLAFLDNVRDTFEKLSRQLRTYLSDKRRVFPRLNFVSDGDLLQLVASARHPHRLSLLMTTCFPSVRALQLTTLGGDVHSRTAGTDAAELPTLSTLAESVNESGGVATSVDAFAGSFIPHATAGLSQIDAVVGSVTLGETLVLPAPLHISTSPEIWMQELLSRMRQAMQDTTAAAMAGPIAEAFQGNFDELVGYYDQHVKMRRDSTRRLSVAATATPHIEIAAIGSSELLISVAAAAPLEPSRCWVNVPMQVILLSMSVLLTSELAQLVNCERTHPNWQSFWSGFYKKKVNLADFLRRREASDHDRTVAATLLTWLINRSAGIHDLFDEPAASVDSASYSSDSSASPCRVNYASGDSFAWLKLMRFHYDPFENQCVVHHAVKSFEYGFAYLGGYACPVLTPLCDRVLLSMSAALAVETGCLLHTGARASAGHIGKRSMARELAAVTGVELVEYTCGAVVGFDQFYRMVRGLLQSDACWLYVSGLETSAVHDTTRQLVQSFAIEMTRLKDALRAHQTAFPLDGEMVEIANPKLTIFVATHLQLASPAHQALLLQLSNSFVPVSCMCPERELIWETMFRACGLKNWKALSQDVTTLFLVVENSAEPFGDASLSSLRLVFAVGRRVAEQCALNEYESEAKCVLVALWGVVRSRVLPARRIAFWKAVRGVLPIANALEFTPLGELTTRASVVDGDSSARKGGEDSPTTIDAATHRSDQSPAVVSSDEHDNDKHQELRIVRELFVACLTARHLVPTESIVRKLVEFFQVVSCHVVTVVVGSAMCGKSSAIAALSCAWGLKSAHRGLHTPDGGVTSSEMATHRMKIAHLFPAAFRTSDVYGHVRTYYAVTAGGRVLPHTCLYLCAASSRRTTDERGKTASSSTFCARTATCRRPFSVNSLPTVRRHALLLRLEPNRRRDVVSHDGVQWRYRSLSEAATLTQSQRQNNRRQRRSGWCSTASTTHRFWSKRCETLHECMRTVCSDCHCRTETSCVVGTQTCACSANSRACSTGRPRPSRTLGSSTSNPSMCCHTRC